MRNVFLAGWWSGLLAFFFTISYDTVQLLQVYRVIPKPLDEILIYAVSLCIVIPFLIEILALHYITSAEKRFWTHASILFSLLYAVFVTANYVVQLATVIPAKLQGHDMEIKILEQTPHSLFWDFDALGYIFMGIAMLFAVPALNKSGQQKYAKLFLLANGLVTPLIAFVYFYPVYSEKLLTIGYPWAITAPLAMLMLAFVFKRELRSRNLT